jgi:molybdenum cofactor cytidylyltransferase
MRAVRIDPYRASGADIEGTVLTHDVGPQLRKGMVLAAADLERLREAGRAVGSQPLSEVHVIRLDPGDVHEDEAARRLGRVMAGEGVEVTGPVQSQVRLTAQRRGLLRVDPALVDDLNRLMTVSVFTLYDGQAVEQGQELAGAKVTPVAVAAAVLEAAEALRAQRGAVLTVVPFKPLRTAIVVTERLKPKARAMFDEAVRRKLGWYGAEVLWTRQVSRSGDAVRDAYVAALESGAELILFAGASSIDPLDAGYVELVNAGGDVLRMGAPSHPGSMLWLGRLGGSPVLGVASCAGFGKNTSLDLVLPFVFAYGRADAGDLARLGHGGLVEQSAGRLFPPYS